MHQASSNCNISYYFDIENDTIYFTVYAFLDKEKSWKKKHIKSVELLEHEQIHFNIAELYARKIRKELFEFEFPKRHLTDTVKNIYNRNIEEYKKAQKAFDAYTQSGLISKKQTDFMQKLKFQLQELQHFSETKYTRILKD